jgi:hypothetical protein
MLKALRGKGALTEDPAELQGNCAGERCSASRDRSPKSSMVRRGSISSPSEGFTKSPVPLPSPNAESRVRSYEPTAVYLDAAIVVGLEDERAVAKPSTIITNSLGTLGTRTARSASSGRGRPDSRRSAASPPGSVNSSVALGGFGEIVAESLGRSARPDAASSVAPIARAIGAPCVLASERASHPSDEHHSAKPS